MKYTFIFLFVIFISVVYSQNKITCSGTLEFDTTWSDTIYVADSIVVPANVSLNILPGCNIRFQNNSYLTVLGKLNAIGTNDSNIVFEPDSGASNWRGFYFIGNGISADSSILSYVKVSKTIKENSQEYRNTPVDVGGSILADNYHFITITNSSFGLFSAKKGTAIYNRNSSLVAENNKFSSGLYSLYTDFPGVVFCDNGNTVINNCNFASTIVKERIVIIGNSGTIEISKCEFSKFQGIVLNSLTVRIDSCKFQAYNENNMKFITGNSLEGTISNNYFEPFETSSVMEPSIRLDNSDITFYNNTFNNNNNISIDVSNGTYQIIDNVFTNRLPGGGNYYYKNLGALKFDSSNVIISGCVFDMNIGKGKYLLSGSHGIIDITGCSFLQSHGQYFANLKLTIDSCKYNSNYREENNTVCQNIEGTIANTLFESSLDYDFAGPILDLRDSELNLFENTFKNNVKNCLTFAGGTYGVENNSFLYNSNSILYTDTSYVAFVNNEIRNNSGGGLLFRFNNSPGHFTGNLLVNNSVNNQLFLISGRKEPDSLYITNNTICNNKLTNTYLTYLIDAGAPTIFHNNIIRNNISRGICRYGDPQNLSFRNNNIEGLISEIVHETSLQPGPGVLFENNFDVDPYFVNPTSDAGAEYETEITAWSLEPYSFCINKGLQDTTGLKLPGKDIAGNDRINGSIDIGALEFMGEIVIMPKMYVACDSIHFGRVKTGAQSEEFNIDIKNFGQGILSIDSITCSVDFGFRINDTTSYVNKLTDIEVEGGDMLKCFAVCIPSTKHHLEGELNIYSNDGLYKVYLEGEAMEDFYLGGTINISQNLSGRVNIFSNVTISKNAEIFIAPGTVINFEDNYIITVNGTLIAKGTEEDSICFTGQAYYSDTENCWGGILFQSEWDQTSFPDSSFLNYCVFTKSISGIKAENYSNLKISNCLFKGNFKVLDLYTSAALVTNNSFVDNDIRYGVITIVFQPQDSMFTKIYNNIFCNNKVRSANVIHFGSLFRANIINNLFINNACDRGVVSYLFGGDSYFINNTVCNNSGGVFYLNASINQSKRLNLTIKNSIFYNNGDSEYNFMNDRTSNANIVIQSNCFEENSYGCKEKNMTKVLADGNNNIISNPLFVNPVAEFNIENNHDLENWKLREDSPCIDRGDTNITVMLPEYDLSGNPRINNRIDIGAFEYLVPVSINPGNEILPDNYKLLQNFPNPFNPVTTIKYSIPVKAGSAAFASSTKVELVIYDILGSKVKTLVNEIQMPGIYNVKFDASKLSSGIYIYRLITDSFTESRKLVLMK